MTDYDLYKTTLAPASGASCDAPLASGAACGQPTTQRLPLTGCTHPVCPAHAAKAALWIAQKKPEKGARIHCAKHGTYTAVAALRIAAQVAS